jgi:hypothetical protein
MTSAKGTASASLLNHLPSEKPPFLDSLGLATRGERKKKRYYLKVTGCRSGSYGWAAVKAISVPSENCSWQPTLPPISRIEGGGEPLGDTVQAALWPGARVEGEQES